LLISHALEHVPNKADDRGSFWEGTIMAKINWTNGSGGDFANRSNWSTGMVPGPSDIANINAPGTYTVTLSASETVLAVTTISTATLDDNGHNFTALAGTGVGANAGTIIVDNESIFITGGTLKNFGTIDINGSSELLLHRDTIFQGGGKLTLSNGQIFNDVSGNTLTNVDNTISGFGTINTNLVNQNNGVIDANDGNGLAVTGNLSNAGVLESTPTGRLVLEGAITNAASGVIGAFGAGSIVTLSATVSGGTLETGSGGKILFNGVTLDGSNGHAVTNTGSVVDNGSILLGTISNTGTIALNGSVISVGTGGVTLLGTGSLTLSDSTENSIIGSGTSTTLTNQNTISGAGVIGGQGLLLTNQGVIDATGVNPLIVDTGVSAVTNTGTLEATNNGELFVASNVTNTGHLIANNGSVIFAGAVSGIGTTTIQGAGSVEFGTTTTSNTTFAAGADGTVTFDAASTLTTGKLSITGFTLGDTIDLADINYVGSGPTLTFTKGVLTVSDGTHVAKLHMVGSYTLANFHAASDGSAGTLITDPPSTSNHSANIALNENTTNHGATDLPTTSTTHQDTSGNMPADAFVFSPNLGQHGNVEPAQDQIQHSEMLHHSELLAAVSADVHQQDIGAGHDASGLEHVLASHLHTAQNSHLV
jgi:hypothetical protein